MNISTNDSEARAEQAASKAQFEAIYLGVDLHKAWIMVTRIIDGSGPQPAQRFSWAGFLKFVAKQQVLARKVYVVYEAGAFGFWLCRQLREQGVICQVCHPEKLDPHHKRVQTDKLDSAHLADKLYRYAQGNPKAMRVVYVPSAAEEQRRIPARHRGFLKKQLLRLKARGRGLLLSQGIFETGSWWQPEAWLELEGRLSAALRAALRDLQALIGQHEQELRQADKQLVRQAPKELPVGFGALSYMLLKLQLCNYQRFKSRRAAAGFTGLCGGVSSSGPYHLDLSINKSGSPELRALLVELAWRMIYYQPHYTGLKVWNRLGRGGSVRRRKIAVVATARQLMVDIWRWQTGQVSPKQLGWRMSCA
ncbi:MAG: transposase [Methanothrix sp.]|nr:transposase [Methanothrix sp.]